MGLQKSSSRKQNQEQSTTSGSDLFNKLKAKLKRSRKTKDSTAPLLVTPEPEHLTPTTTGGSNPRSSGASRNSNSSQLNIQTTASSGDPGSSGTQSDIHNSIGGDKGKGVLNTLQGASESTSTSTSGISPNNFPEITVGGGIRTPASSVNGNANVTGISNSDPKTSHSQTSSNRSGASAGVNCDSRLIPLAWQEVLNNLPLEEQNILRKDLEALITVHFAQGIQGSSNLQNMKNTQITSAVLTALFKVAEEKRRECEQKKWKIRIPGGKEIVLRAVVEKILDFANRFREIGTIAVQYDPAAAALPWAGFVLILQFATADIELLGIILSGLEEVARVIADGAFYEKLYLSDERIKHLLSPTTLDRFQATLAKEYSAIISYLITIISICRTNSLKKTVKGPWYLSEVQSGLNSVCDAESNLRKNVDQVESELRKLTDEHAIKHLKEFKSELSAILNRRFFRQHEQMHKMLQFLDDEERAKILIWLSTIDYTNHHAHIRKGRLQNTGDWLQREENFIKWQGASGSSCIWLIGGAGTGKSTLVSHVIDTLMSDATRSNSSEAFAYFYCNRDDPERRKPEVIMSSIVKQLACLKLGGDLQKVIIEEYNIRKRETGAPSPLNLVDGSELAKRLCDIYPQSIIIVDALDECDPEIRHELVLELYRLAEECSSLVKILVTSRPDDDLTTFVKSKAIPTVILDASQRGNDIKNIAWGKVEEAITKRGLLRNTLESHDTLDLKRQMVEIIIEGAQGMPLWITHQLNYICGNTRTLRTVKQVLDALRAFPKGLKGTYDYILQNILSDPEEKFNALAIRAFQWVMTAIRPLAPDELLGALDPGLEEHNIQDITHILDICHNMLVLDQVGNVIRFYHLSVRDYLEIQWPRLFKPTEEVRELVIEEPLLLLGQVDSWDDQTQTYLSSTMDCSLPRIRSLLSYTSHHWPRHLNRKSVSIAAQGLLLGEKSYEAYLDMIYWLQLDSIFNDSHIMDFSVDVKVREDLYFDCPLSVAVYWGLYEIFKLVMKQGLSVSDPKGLFGVAMTGLYKQVLDLRPDDPEPNIGPFLRYFAETNNNGLLRHGEIIAQGVVTGHVGLVKYFLETSTDDAVAKEVIPQLVALTEDVRARSKDIDEVLYVRRLGGPVASDALLEAARYGYADVVRLLVEDGLTPAANGMAIKMAIMKGQEEIASYLIENANTDQENLKIDISDQCILEEANLRGYENIVKILVDKGLWDIRNLVQVLNDAYGNGKEGLWRYLVKKCVNLDNREDAIQTALKKNIPPERILEFFSLEEEALQSVEVGLRDSEVSPGLEHRNIIGNSTASLQGWSELG